MLHQVFAGGPFLLLHGQHASDDLKELIRVLTWYAINLAKLDFVCQLDLVGRLKRSTQRNNLVEYATC